MDALKRGRKAKRTAFTRSHTALVALLQMETPNLDELRAQFALFRDRTTELQDLNERIMVFMQEDLEITDEELVAEMTSCDDYQLKYQQVKVRVSQLIEPPQPAQPPFEFNATQMNQSAQESSKVKLPKLKLQKFDGEIKNWLPFWNRFKSIHTEESIKVEDKFQYLCQSMQENSRASEVVNSFPTTAENYQKAVDALEQRFGRKELLIEVYVRELLQLVLNNNKTAGENSIVSIYDKLETRLRALESLGVTTEMCAAMLYPLVESALPADTLKTWQRHPTSAGVVVAKDRLDALMKFLLIEVQAEQRVEMAADGFGLKTEKKERVTKEKPKKGPTAEAKGPPTAAVLVSTKDTHTLECIFCEGPHESADCDKARQMSYQERCNIAAAKNACYNCLKIGHGYLRCRFKHKCNWCTRRHVLLMCRDMTGPSTSQPPGQKKDKTEEHSLANFSEEPEVFLQTLRVKLVNGEKKVQVRALLDPGSHRSYILGRVAEQIGYPVAEMKTMSHLLFGGARTEPHQHNCYLLHLRSLDESYACNFKAFDQEIICQNVRSVVKGPWMQELERNSINLTDIQSRDPTIGLLIGADIVGKLYTGRKLDLECGATALETHLGWTMLGKHHTARPNRADTALLTVSMFASDANVSQLWRLDVLGITDPVEQKSKDKLQQEVLSNFRETTKINAEGRYEVTLPWKDNHVSLPDNRTLAEKRLQNTVRKLIKDNLLLEYEKVFDQWLADGIIEEVPEDEVGNMAHYLPHRHVVKEGSTTRIRPVFDASAREGKAPSLNQCLEPGPNLIERIPKLLRRFRARAVGLIADIRQAFLQVSVDPKLRDMLRFLWRRCSGQLVHYRHCRVVFGVTSSPFLLGGTIELHVDAEIQRASTERVREILRQLKGSFYVDNAVTSLDTTEEAEFFQKTATDVMRKGGFELRGWESSHAVGDRSTTLVLGMEWNKSQDVLQLPEEVLVHELPSTITKRTILSIAQKVFDPLGIATPALLFPKLMLQKLWNSKIDWDTEVPVDVRRDFVTWCQQLPLLRELKIARWNLASESDEVSVHLFVDASKDAYAAVIYVRIQSENSVRVEFMESKSRVTPKEKTTIPRLELLAATVGARLLSSVLNDLQLTEITVYCWTDSSTALAWIQRDSQWGTFVSNRVREIRELTKAESWRHIPGERNPADLPSRGCSPRQLTTSDWIAGPGWLQLPACKWPTSQVVIDEDVVKSEMRKSAVKGTTSAPVDVAVTVSCVAEVKESEIPWYLRQFSKYPNIVRLVAWIKRFLHNAACRKEDRDTGELTVQEIKCAERNLLRIVQAESFDGVKDPRLNTMIVYKDDHGLLRLASPVERRDDSIDFRHPVILDPHHRLVERMIEHEHETLGHAPIDTVICVLRERVWIIQCRKAVRTVIQRCVVCRRYNARRLETLPAALPENRVRDAKIFEITGVDFAGPLYLEDGSKVWVCLFTCAVYRAVHLELVSALNTEKFLEALRRFIVRKARPSIIYADNGTNFRGASNLLKGIDWSKLQKVSTIQEIQWLFNPPSAPWWGGWWERLIRIVKELLRKILRKTSLTYEELCTVLCDCESTINRRPLTYLAEDPQQLTPLTPRLFLQEIEEDGVLDLDAVNTASLNRRLRYRQELRRQLRERFRLEYLGQLQNRVSKAAFYRTIKVGDIVLCGNDLQKRFDWPLAKVIEIYPGRDGQIRVVKVKTAAGELTRTVQRLFPLEISDEQRESFHERLSQRIQTVSPKLASGSTSTANSGTIGVVPEPLSNCDAEKIDHVPIVPESPKLNRVPEPSNAELPDSSAHTKSTEGAGTSNGHEVLSTKITRGGRVVKRPAKYRD